MTLTHSRIAAAALFLLAGFRAGAVEIFPLDELRPGMQGTAYSVFRGDSVSAFGVEVLDRLTNRGDFDMVLIRGDAALADLGGMSQGMSGSPVYLDGRLLGAIAFNFSFSTAPLAMLTPAAAMSALAERESESRSESGGGADLAALFDREAWRRPLQLGRAGASAPLCLALGGLDPAATQSLETLFANADLRLIPMGQEPAGSGGKPGEGEALLAPGSAVAIELVRGPVSLAAIGTLTRLEGDRFWAFGHPFLDEGPVSLPLAGARVHGVVPSLMNPYKLATVGAPLGTVLVDGRAGIFGRLGEAPPMLPLAVRVQGERLGESETARFEIARHKRLLPVLARMAVQGWLQGPLAMQDTGELALTLTLYPSSTIWPRPVTLSDRFAGEASPQAAAAWLQSLLEAFATLSEAPPLDSLSLDLRWSEATQARELERFSVERAALRPGDAWHIEARFRQGEELSDVDSWRFPDDGDLPVSAIAPGDYRLHLGDARSFHAWNAQRQPELYRFHEAGALMAFLESLEPAGSWIVWLEGEGRSSVISRHEVALPAYFARLLPESAASQDKKARRLLGRRSFFLPSAAESRGHLSVPVTVLPHPVRSSP